MCIFPKNNVIFELRLRALFLKCEVAVGSVKMLVAENLVPERPTVFSDFVVTKKKNIADFLRGRVKIFFSS